MVIVYVELERTKYLQPETAMKSWVAPGIGSDWNIGRAHQDSSSKDIASIVHYNHFWDGLSCKYDECWYIIALAYYNNKRK